MRYFSGGYKYIFRTFPSSIFYMLSLEIMPMRRLWLSLMGMRAHLFPKLMQHIHIALIILLVTTTTTTKLSFLYFSRCFFATDYHSLSSIADAGFLMIMVSGTSSMLIISKNSL